MSNALENIRTRYVGPAKVNSAAKTVRKVLHKFEVNFSLEVFVTVFLFLSPLKDSTFPGLQC